MKICFLAPASSIHTIRWINSLVNRGNEIHLITMHSQKLDQIDKRVKIYTLPIKAPFGYYLNFFILKVLIKKIKPDLINTHYASGYGTLSRLLKFKPTILSVWGSDVFDFPFQSQIKLRIIKKNLKSPNHLGSTSHIMKKQIESLLKTNKSITITPFGIDIDKFKFSKKVDENFITIGLVKKLEPVYGIEYLLESVNLLRKKLVKIGCDKLAQSLKILIVGDGKQRQYLEKLSLSLGLQNITTFTGAVPNQDVPFYLNQMDICCNPSIRESFGVAVLEASACKKPVIVTNVGGLPEVVKDNVTGFIVPPRDSNALAQKLLELILDSKLRTQMGENGRRFVEEHYSWEHSINIMEETYKRILLNTKKEN